MKKVLLFSLFALAIGAVSAFANTKQSLVKADDPDPTPDFSEDFEGYTPGGVEGMENKWTNAWFKHIGDYDEIACSSDNFNVAVDPENAENKCLYVHTYEANESFFYLTMKDIYVKDFRLTYKYYQTSTHGAAPWTGFNFRKEIDGRYNGVTNVMMVIRAWSDVSFGPQMYRGVGDSFMFIELDGPGGEGTPALSIGGADEMIDQWLDIKIEAIGSVFSIYANDTLLGSKEITKKTANCYGYVSLISCVCDAYYDDIHLENLDEEPYNPGGSGEGGDVNAPTMEKKAYEVKLGEDLVIECDTHGEAITSFRRGAEELLPQYYEVDGNKITIFKELFATLEDDRNYFFITTAGGTVAFTVDIIRGEQGGDDSEPVTPPSESEQPGESSEEKPAKKGGCGGSIIATSALLGIISVMGIALVSIKRKEK